MSLTGDLYDKYTVGGPLSCNSPESAMNRSVLGQIVIGFIIHYDLCDPPSSSQPDPSMGFNTKLGNGWFGGTKVLY
ncbi:hypothetical protein X801_10543, partial [Opisthorchis viverrini]